MTATSRARTRILTTLATGGLCALGLLGCSAGSSDSADPGAARDTPTAQDQLAAVGKEAEAAAATTKGGDTRTSEISAVSPSDSMLARNASLTIEVDDTTTAAARIRTVANAAGGRVTNESIVTSGGNDTETTPWLGTSTIIISVPSARLDATLDQLAGVGTVTHRAIASVDVKAVYVDTTARLETMKASVERVRALMSKAEKIGDIVVLEGELSRRQADVEALSAQVRALTDQVAMSPIAIALAAPGTTQPENESGFVSGLKSGWQALKTSTVALVTILGAVLPFALATLLVAVPLWVWVRRRRPGSDAPAAPVPPHD